jgi:predicted transposase YbfD/YdcC
MTKKELVASIREYFAELEDPRIERTRLHSLDSMIIISILAVICGADGFVAIEQFAQAREEWLRSLLDLQNGIPSHDTFGRVFAALEPRQLTEAFQRWTYMLAATLRGEVIAIDGKTLRRSFRTASKSAFTHMVSAWATKNRLVVGQVSTSEKSNEIEAIPRLLDLLDLRGAMVTTDAMGCQREIARKIVDKGADYLLAVKENQPTLHADVAQHFATDSAEEFDFVETHNRGHGRQETRRCWVSHDLAKLTTAAAWAGLTTLVCVESERVLPGKEPTSELRYFISSRTKLTAKTALASVRAHWGIENALHWVLDVAYREDDSRIRVDNAAENFSIIRQLTANLLTRATSIKVGIKNKRLRAGWDDAFLLSVLAGTG